MRTLEELFIKEFKENTRLLGNKDIYSIPLPDLCKKWEVSGTEEYQVQGIDDEYYGKLNEMIVRRLPRGTVAKRRVIDKATRGYKKNEDGEYMYQDFSVPSGSTVVLSHVNIGLPYKRYIKDIDGYGYIDYTTDKEGKVLYMYALPKDVLYKVNQTALALSVKNMKNYSGIGLTTWDYGVIFVHVIPYNPNSQYVGTKILKTAKTTDFNRDIHLLTDFWQQQGIIPNIKLCALQDDTNLCLKPTITGYDFYEPVDLQPLGYREIYGSDGASASIEEAE